jgi:hypothetical protein
MSMFKLKIVHGIIFSFFFLTSSVSTAAVVTLTPLTATTVTPGTDIQFNLVADFGTDVTDGGAVDFQFDPNVAGFGSFQFEPGFTTRDTGFDVIDSQSPGLLSIGFGSASNTFTGAAFDVGILTLRANGIGNTLISLSDSIRHSGFVIPGGGIVPVTYMGSSVSVQVQAVPIPASGWLLFSSLVFLTRVSRHKS